MLNATRSSWPKRILLAGVGIVFFLLIFVIAVRLTVREVYRSVSSRASGLAATTAWDLEDSWQSRSTFPVDNAQIPAYTSSPISAVSIARVASVLTHSSSFDRSAARLQEIASAHQGFLEELQTSSHSGEGRNLAATLAVPSREFDTTLADLKTLGRTEAVSETGEDSTVRIATGERHLAAAQTNLSRLQKLQHERKGELSAAVSLEKDVAQAREALDEAQRQQENLRSIVSQGHIRVTLIEDYRAPFDTNLAGASLALRNSLVEGLAAIFSSAALILGVFFEYGLPILFWAALLFVPARYLWRRFHRAPLPASSAV